jgi:hypothetical protein
MESLAIGTRKLITLLLPRSDFLAVMTSGRFKAKMKLKKFPVKAQICIRQFPYYECVRSPNQIVYFGPYFHTPSTEQAQPLLRDDANPAMMVDFKELFFISLLRFPKDYPSAFELVNIRYQSGVNMGPLVRGVASVSDPAHSIPGLVFGKLADILHTTPIGFLNRSGIFGWIDGSPYLVLLHESLKDFIPHGGSSSSTFSGGMRSGVGGSSNVAGGSSTGSTVGGSLTPIRGGGGGGISSSSSSNSSNRAARGAGSALFDKVRLSQAGELYLRLMADYWMDVATLVRRNHADGVSFKAQLNKTVEYFNSGSKHPLPTEILALDTSSMRWESSTMQCNYLVLVRTLSDPCLADLFHAIVNENAAIAESPLGHSGSSSAKGASNNQQALLVSCPPALSIMQQPLFDMIRTIFNKAQQFTGSDRDMYALAVEVWLLYLQPWRAPALARGTPLDKIEKAPEMYGAAYDRDTWLPYVASNLHFYTTLLACFMQSCSKVDLSVTEDSGMVHLLLLEKVLMAFDAFKDDVDMLTADFRAWYPSRSRDAYGGGGGGRGGYGNNTPFRSPAQSRHTTPRHTHNNSAGGSSSSSSSSAVGARGQTPIGLLAAIRAQHHSLFPDPAIDRDVPYCGIVAVSEYCAEEAQKLISTLHVAMRDVNSRKGGAAALESAADVLDHLLGIKHWGLGQNFTITRLVKGLSSAGQVFSTAGQVASNAVLSERLKHDVKKIDSLVHCGVPSAISPRFGGAGWNDGATVSSDGPGSSGGGGGGYGLHDEITGQLTPQARQKLRSGHKLNVDDLRWFDDVLLMPYCSYEVHTLALFFIDLSQRLNQKYGLPAHQPAARWPWKRVFSQLHQIALLEDATIGEKALEARQLFRFNLRFLAGVRVACPLAMFLTHFLVPRVLLGWVYYVIMAFLSFLYFRDTTYMDNVNLAMFSVFAFLVLLGVAGSVWL